MAKKSQPRSLSQLKKARQGVITGRDEGRITVDPKTGDRRIKLSDVVTKDPSDTIRISLYDLLNGSITIEGNGDKTVKLRPLSLNGLAELEEIYAHEGGVAALGRRPTTMADYRRIVTVLANQGAPDEDRMTEKQVGDMLSAENMLAVVHLVNDVLRGPLGGITGTPTAMPGAQGSGSPTGAGSSGGARPSSDTPPESSEP